MQTRLRIVVTGLAATYPFGGVFWDYLQYAIGFHKLGHEVLYLEDTGKWCYDPVEGTFVEDGSRNARYLAKEIKTAAPDLANSWFYRDGTGTTFGRPWKEVVEFCRTADLFVHVSASCWMREEYFAAKKVVFIDSDPMYTQSSVPGYLSGEIDDQARSRVDLLREHDVFFSFGENIGSADCIIPTALFDWIPTRQPVLLEHFENAGVPVGERRRVLTTVASWEPTESGPVVEGVKYHGKSKEFERFIDFPEISPLPLELAMSGKSPNDRLRSHGWQVINAYPVSSDPWVYRDYLARSFGEWSVAKNAYVASRSGWFSCRTACYLALGVPAVVQDTAFSTVIPTGKGLFAFNSKEEAADAVSQILADPERHASAARNIAREYFDSDKVLSRFIDDALKAGK
jgi:glycosyltransferase involved in cell wall biosynthesis